MIGGWASKHKPSRAVAVPLTSSSLGRSEPGAYPLPARGSRAPHIQLPRTIRAGSLSPACDLVRVIPS